LAKFDYVGIIEVNSLTDKNFKINYNDLKDILDYGVNYDAFSAEDLWFYTNSI
jgi:hypothetical protein